MISKRWWLMLVGSVVLLACKKEPLPELPEENDPVYYFRGEVDGDDYNLNVGLNQVNISNGVDEINGINTYWGQINSVQDGFSAKFEIIRPELFISQQGVKALNEGDVPFFVDQPGCYVLDFGQSQNQLNYILIKDEFNNFELMDQIEFPSYGNYNLTMKFTDFGQNSFTIPFSHGFEATELSAKFDVYGNQDTICMYPVNESGSHEWYVNGVLVSTDVIYKGSISGGIHKVKHVITDEFNNRNEFTTLIRMQYGYLNWQLKLQSCSQAPVESQYGKIIVSVYKDNQWFRSDNVITNLNEEINVSEIEYSGPSILEAANIIFKAQFDCVLYNENHSDSISLKNIVAKYNAEINY